MLLNLLSDYPYQLEIRFQYHFGITAFLLLLTVMNWNDLSGKIRRYLLLVSLAAAFVFYSYYVLPEFCGRIKTYHENHESFEVMEDTLSVIPEDASVNASTFFLPHLAQRWEAYDVGYHPEADTDFVILDIRGGYHGDEQEMAVTCLAAGYIRLVETKQIALFVSPEWDGDAAELKEDIRAVATIVSESKTMDQRLDDMKEIMSVVPEDASINASVTLVPHISEREVLCDITNHPVPDTDFVILDLRFGYREDTAHMLSGCLDWGFGCLIENDDIAIWVSPLWLGDFTAMRDSLVEMGYLKPYVYD
jgi:hypothetical protein